MTRAERFDVQHRDWSESLVTPSSDGYPWRATFGDSDGPSGHVCSQTVHEALELALRESLVLAEVVGGPEAETVASEVQDHRAAVQIWLEADDDELYPGPARWER